MESFNVNPVSGVNAAPKVTTVASNASSQSQNSGTDKVEISSQGMYLSNLVNKVSSMPDVRENVVQDFKQQVSSGVYPPPSIIEGLTHLLGMSANTSSQGSKSF
jgi:flagellar biosynthesis anti-sigma factor FlgM